MSLHPLKHVIKLLLAVSFPDNFKPAYDQFHLKQGVISLELFLDPCEYFDLSTHADFRSLVINNHAEYVSEFEYEDVLLDEDLADLDQTALEELVVVDQVARQHELRLERRPDRVGLLAAALLPREQDLLSQVGIENLSLRPVLAEDLSLLVTFFCYTIFANLK